MSIMWVEEIADELVVLMNALGSMAGIQPFVMGLTILAVGNSISDLVGDITITKQGYPQMAIGGIYACRRGGRSQCSSADVLDADGPRRRAGNSNDGVSVGLRAEGVRRRDEAITLGEDTIVINLTFIFLLLTLLTTLIVVPLQKYTYTKKFGVILISIYLLSMILNLLATCGILHIPFLEPKTM